MVKGAALIEAKDGEVERTRSLGSEGFGGRLKVLRLRAGLSQSELAVKAKVTRSHISFLEHGNGGAAMPTLKKLATALKTTPSYLLFGVYTRKSRARKKEAT